MELSARITINEKICGGKPIIRGKRITVQTIMEYLSVGETEGELLKQFPTLEADDIKACLLFASKLMDRHYIVKSLSN